MRVVNDLYKYNRNNINTSFMSKQAAAKQVSSTVKKGLRHIDNSMYCELSSEYQTMMKNITENTSNIETLLSSLAKSVVGRIAIRNKYIDSKISNMIHVKKAQGYVFKMPESETIVKLYPKTERKNLTKLHVEQDNKIIPYVIDGYNKVASNINPNFPAFTPQKLRYMTAAQIRESNIKTYIEFIDKELQKYTDYLSAYKSGNLKLDLLNNATRPEPITDIETSAQKNEYSRARAINSLIKLLQGEKENLPKHLNPLLSPSDKIVGFKFKDGDNVIRIAKKVNANYRDSLQYLSIEEIPANGVKHTINIDWINKRILKTSISGKPIIQNDCVDYYSEGGAECKQIDFKIKKYMDIIFSKEFANAAPENQEVITLKAAAPHPVPKTIEIDDASFEDLDDKSLNKLLGKEYKLEEISRQETAAPENKELAPEVKLPKEIKEKPEGEINIKELIAQVKDLQEFSVMVAKLYGKEIEELQAKATLQEDFNKKVVVILDSIKSFIEQLTIKILLSK